MRLVHVATKSTFTSPQCVPTRLMRRTETSAAVAAQDRERLTENGGHSNEFYMKNGRNFVGDPGVGGYVPIGPRRNYGRRPKARLGGPRPRRMGLRGGLGCIYIYIYTVFV